MTKAVALLAVLAKKVVLIKRGGRQNVEAERDRYQSALEAIHRDHSPRSRDECESCNFAPPCPTRIRAGRALNGTGPVHDDD